MNSTIMADMETSVQHRTRRRRMAVDQDPSASSEPGLQLITYRRGRKAFENVFRATLLILSIAVISLVLRPWSYFRKDAVHTLDYSTRTHRLLSQTPLIDGHNDLPFLIRQQLRNQIYNEKLPFAISGYTFPGFQDNSYCSRTCISYRP